jgi:excisionase family DNA binding protein
MTEFNRADYLTTGQAAHYLGVSTETVRRWLEAGRLTGVRTSGGHRLISRTSVQEHQPRPIEVDR